MPYIYHICVYCTMDMIIISYIYIINQDLCESCWNKKRINEDTCSGYERCKLFVFQLMLLSLNITINSERAPKRRALKSSIF